MKTLASLTLFASATLAFADAPKIVSTTPKIGATNVDPGTTALMVTFDQPMAEGFSWTGGGEQFPTIPNGKKPSWSADRKTCTLPVQLEPGKKYRLGINSKSYRNFKNTSGESVTPTVFTFATGIDESATRNQAGDVLLNDSFEDGTNLPHGWESRPIKGVKLTWDKRVAYTGERSLRLMKTVNGYFPIASWARRIEHKNSKAEAIQLDAFVKANKAKKCVLDILFLDADAKWIEHKWTKYIGEDDTNPEGVTADWTKHTGTVAIPDGTQFIEVSVQMYGPGTVWVDDIKATYVDAPKVDAK